MSHVIGRDEQKELLEAFLGAEVSTAPPSLIVHGPTSTGKTLTLRCVLDQLKVRQTWVSCDECVSSKILWKKVMQGIRLDSGKVGKKDLTLDALSTGSFQAFLKQLHDFVKDYDYNEMHYVVLDRCDQIMEDGDDLFRNFRKFHEVTSISNICVIFVCTTIPRQLITATIPAVCFDNYTSQEAIFILSDNVLCQFPENLFISTKMQDQFWESYVKLIVESYYTYTTNVVLLRSILIKLWPKFIEPVISGEIKLQDFHLLYRKNFKLIGSEFAITTSIVDDLEDQEETLTSNLPNMSKILLLAGYIASFNDVKYDWVFFAKLKDYHKKKTGHKSWRTVRVDSRLLEPSPFDLERLFAITHALYNIESGLQLAPSVDLMTQVANLGSMKLFLKSSNVDYIGGKTKWKINCSYDFIKGIANDLSFPIDNYLAE